MTARDSKARPSIQVRAAWEGALEAALHAKATELAEELHTSDDAVLAALASALERAASAGQWSAVEALARELEARRRARAGVVELDAERAKRLPR